MPHSRSAKKSLRQNRKRRMHNRAQRSALRSSIKKFRKAAEAGDPQAAEPLFRATMKKPDQAAAKKLIHKNAAARTKSRLSKLLPKPQSTEVE